MKRALLISYTFVLMNWAAVVGLFHFVLGHKDIWVRHRAAHFGPMRRELQPRIQ